MPKRNDGVDWGKAYLACGHTSMFFPPASIGDTVLCFECSDWLEVIAKKNWREYRAEWGIRCQTCHYARLHGQARLNAELAGMRHRRKTGHVVEIQYANKTRYVFDGRGQVTISQLEGSDDAPF